MSLPAAIYTRATSHAGLSALISTRCYPDLAAQEATAPFLVYQVISADRQRTFGKRAQIVQSRVQIDAYASTHAGVVALAAQVIDAFDNWQGTSASVTIHDSALDTERSLTELEDTSTALFRHSMDFTVQYGNPAYV